MTTSDKSKPKRLNYLDHKIKVTRVKQNLLVRQVASYFQVDTALMSKTERDERNLNRPQVLKVAKFLKVSADEFISLWLCDKVIDAVGEDPLATQAIKKALTKIKN